MVVKNTKNKNAKEFNMELALEDNDILEDRPSGRENRSQVAQVKSGMNHPKRSSGKSQQ